MIHVFTSAAMNYLPKVRLLAQSIKKFHQEFVIHLVLADVPANQIDLTKEPFDNVLTIEELDIPNAKQWIFFHNIVELSTAIKPFALLYLLNLKNCDGVIYFDPDMVLFSRLDDLLIELQRANMLLTPHLVAPETTLPAIVDNEICSLKHGIFNLGFIAVNATAQGKQFAAWWAERLYHFCSADLSLGLFTDQKWLNFAPVFFAGVTILKSPRFNVAPWNLSTRNVTGNFAEGFKVNNEPLGFYHFTGFDRGAHKVMAEKYAPKNQAVETLITWYEEEQRRDVLNIPWGFASFSNGKPITQLHRSVFRERKDLQELYLNPFEADSANCYFTWFAKNTLLLRYSFLGKKHLEENDAIFVAKITRVFVLVKLIVTQPRQAWIIFKKIFKVLCNRAIGKKQTTVS